MNERLTAPLLLAANNRRVSAENKRLTEMLTAVYKKYSTLKRQFEYVSCISPPPPPPPKKSKSLGSSSGNSSSTEENFISHKKPISEEAIVKNAKIARIRTEASDTSQIVKDGYTWRKYGQKVTRDNPSPRAYFKCSCAPSCPVKKKVQRSVEDHAVLIATYEGEHNHPQESPNGNNSSRRNMTMGNGNNSSSRRNMSMGNGSIHRSTATTTTMPLKASAPPITLDLTTTSADTSSQRNNTIEFHKFMIDWMASSLTNDTNFTTALAAAISGRFTNQN